MAKKNRRKEMKYETPIVMKLGDLAEGEGNGNCNSGTQANGHCWDGGSAHGSGGCKSGHIISTGPCDTGSSFTE